MRITSTSISASAGTGKTYQLSRRFLALLALNHGKNPEQLIAITFTKKAAGEFLDRILSDIAKGASCEEEASKLADEIWETIKGDGTNPETNPEANIGICPDLPNHKKDELLNLESFKKMLRTLVENLVRLNLCTIDSLFGKFAKSCIFDLGITDFQILSTDADKNQARNEVLVSLYQDCATNDNLRQEFEEAFLNTFEKDSQVKNIKESPFIDNLETLLDCYSSAPEETKWGIPQSILQHYTTPKIPTINEFVKKIRKAKEYYNKIPKLDKKQQEIKAILSALDNYPNTLTLTFPKNEKLSQSLRELKESLAGMWEPSMDDILQTWACYELALTQNRTKSVYKLTKLIAEKYIELINQSGRFEFRDVPILLKSKKLTPQFRQELQYRMFCQYRHWMLDEFQDTSHVQWNIIKPFIDDLQESDGENSSAFIVGDLKQSIYQWRGGDPRLFLNAPRHLNLHNRTMSESYRSNQYILNLVNDVCDYKNSPIASLISPKALEMWGDFPKHKACAGNINKKGEAQIWRTSNGKPQTIADTIANIYYKLKDVEEKSIAILVDQKEHGLKLRDALREHDLEAIVCDDVSIGLDSSIGKVLNMFFHWLYMPGDTHTENLLKLSHISDAIFTKENTSSSWEFWRQLIEKSGYSGALDTLRKNISSLNIKISDYQQNRFNVWQASAKQADKEGIEIEVWLERIATLQIREDSTKNVIQIMTIHKSKGLGFDIVFVPSIGNDKAFDSENHLHYLISKNNEGGITSVIKNPTNSLIFEVVPELENLKESWRAEQHFDGLCKLYVALTRAKEACYAIVPYVETPTDNITESKSKFKLSVRSALCCHKRDVPESVAKTATGDARCIYHAINPERKGQPYIVPKKASQEKEKPVIDFTNATPIWPDAPIIRKRLSPSRLHHSTPEETTQLVISEEMRTAAQFGTEVHSVFERIGRWDVGNKPAWLIEPTTDAERAVAECFENPEICELFTVSESAQIMREQNIESVDAEKWISGTIDRLVIDGNKATIIDFKTDRCSIEEMKNRHTAQLHAYAEIVNQITGIPLDNIECKLVSTKHKCIISI